VGQKLANTSSFVSDLIIVQATRKNLESRTQLDEPAERSSGGNSLLLYKILHFLFFPLVRNLCALPQFESIFDGHHSHYLLPAPFRLEIENTN
jgi:hypothetical protein